MKAMILCAGYGTRLGALTHHIPKPMLPLSDRPLLEYIICHLARHGFNQIAINLHFMPEVIRDYFRDGSPWGVELAYSYEPELLGTAGGVKKMESFFGPEEAFLIHYGDILTDQDFNAMFRFHQQSNARATLLVHQRANSNSIVTLDERGCVTGFLERPTEAVRGRASSTWVNSGIYICNSQLLSEIPANMACDFPRDIFPGLVARGHLYGYSLSAYRCAIDSPERLAQAQTAITTSECQIPLPDKQAIMPLPKYV
jgi:mannose-1-phosphate guanylyltransferase/phosphomannomutase